MVPIYLGCPRPGFTPVGRPRPRPCPLFSPVPVLPHPSVTTYILCQLHHDSFLATMAP